MYNNQRGVTVWELLVSLTVTAVLLGIGIPSFASMVATRRVEGAATQLQMQLEQLRGQAIRKNSPVFLTFSVAGSQWSYGANDAGACNPLVSGSCKIDGVEELFNGNAWQGVTLSINQGFANSSLGFEPRRGMAIEPGGAVGFGTITLQSTAGQLQINVSPIGYINICTPSGSRFTRYASCIS